MICCETINFEKYCLELVKVFVELWDAIGKTLALSDLVDNFVCLAAFSIWGSRHWFPVIE